MTSETEATSLNSNMEQQLLREQNLVVAARQGLMCQVKELIDAGVCVNAVDEFGMTPLMLLASQGLDRGLELLLDNPTCLVNKRTSSMVVALHFAAEKGHFGCVKQLLEHSAVINVSDDWGETPLIKAAGGDIVDETRRVAVVSLLLNNGARTEMIDLHGRDALVHAARCGATNTVRVLLGHGANPNQGSRALPLHEAAAFGHVGCVEALLEAGARANLRNLHGHQPLELATQMDHSSVVSCLLKQSNPSSDLLDLALATAVSSNAIRCLDVLLSCGANADAVNYGGVPVLHMSVDHGHRDATLMLLRYNASVNRRYYQSPSRMEPDIRDACATLSIDYVTPIILAVLRGRLTLMKPLVRAGASLGAVLKLVQGGYSSRRMLPALSSDVDLVRWLRLEDSSVISLMRIARLAVRASLRSHRRDVIGQLPLPRSLIDFVAFSDLEDD